MQVASENTSLLSTEQSGAAASQGENTQPETAESPVHTGARPKVRNPKEAKRRRFVMKQAKAIAKAQLLESVSETEESLQQTLLPSSTDDPPLEGKHRKCPEFFGVRSYVHTFYEAMAMDDPQAYDDFGNSNFGYLLPSRKRRRRRLCWRACLWSGVATIGFGLIILLTAFLVPKRQVIVGIQEDIEIVNRANEAFNAELDISKIIGIVMFCSGGCMLVGVLLTLTLMKRHGSEDSTSSEGIPIAEDEPPRSPTDIKVPATEELTAVQPKRMDPDEVVMTNAGLCKIPPP